MPKKEYRYKSRKPAKKDVLKTIDVEDAYKNIDVEDMNGYTVSYPGVSNVKNTHDKEGEWLEFDSLQDGRVRHMRVLNGKIR